MLRLFSKRPFLMALLIGVLSSGVILSPVTALAQQDSQTISGSADIETLDPGSALAQRISMPIDLQLPQASNVDIYRSIYIIPASFDRNAKITDRYVSEHRISSIELRYDLSVAADGMARRRDPFFTVIYHGANGRGDEVLGTTNYGDYLVSSQLMMRSFDQLWGNLIKYRIGFAALGTGGSLWGTWKFLRMLNMAGIEKESWLPPFRILLVTPFAKRTEHILTGEIPSLVEKGTGAAGIDVAETSADAVKAFAAEEESRFGWITIFDLSILGGMVTTLTYGTYKFLTDKSNKFVFGHEKLALDTLGRLLPTAYENLVDDVPIKPGFNRQFDYVAAMNRYTLARKGEIKDIQDPGPNYKAEKQSSVSSAEIGGEHVRVLPTSVSLPMVTSAFRLFFKKFVVPYSAFNNSADLALPKGN